MLNFIVLISDIFQEDKRFLCSDQVLIHSTYLPQVVNWAIQQKAEKRLEEAMERLGIPFAIYEVQGDDGKSSTTKWTSLEGMYFIF